MIDKNARNCMVFAVIILFLINFPLFVQAGDEQNPEIIDEENDLFKHPYFPVINRSLKSIDILSAWFYENQNESNYLFITIKVVDLKYLFLRSAYLVTWRHSDYVYNVRLNTQFFGLYSIADITRSYPNKINLISAIFDKENNLVTFKIPKNLIGDPQPGDVLTRTRVGSFIGTALSYVLNFCFAADYAPNFQASGKNYIIQY